jgi:hypothetical protein
MQHLRQTITNAGRCDAGTGVGGRRGRGGGGGKEGVALDCSRRQRGLRPRSPGSAPEAAAARAREGCAALRRDAMKKMEEAASDGATRAHIGRENAECGSSGDGFNASGGSDLIGCVIEAECSAAAFVAVGDDDDVDLNTLQHHTVSQGHSQRAQTVRPA